MGYNKLMSKPIKESVAFYALNEAGQFLAVKRAKDDESLPGVWGLVGGSLKDGEAPEDTVRRAALQKLGVAVVIKDYTGDDTIDRGNYILHLREYEVELQDEPKVPQLDASVSQYEELQFSSSPELLREAANKGSLCSRIFLRNRGLWEG